MAASTETQQNRPPMDQVATGFRTKSDKIRVLSRAGYSRAEIARYLDIRYQHVRNVLVDDERAGRAAPPIQPAETPSGAWHLAQPDGEGLRPVSVRVEADGRVSIPAEFCRAQGLKENDPVIVALENDAIRVMSVAAAVRRAQAIVRRLVPPDVSLVDELIAERREEARREDDND